MAVRYFTHKAGVIRLWGKANEPSDVQLADGESLVELADDYPYPNEGDTFDETARQIVRAPQQDVFAIIAAARAARSS